MRYRVAKRVGAIGLTSLCMAHNPVLSDESVERWISKRTVRLVDEVTTQPERHAKVNRVSRRVLMTELPDESLERWISKRTVRLVDEVTHHMFCCNRFNAESPNVLEPLVLHLFVWRTTRSYLTRASSAGFRNEQFASSTRSLLNPKDMQKSIGFLVGC